MIKVYRFYFGKTCFSVIMHFMNTIDFKNTKLLTLYGRFLLPTLIAVISNSLYCIVDVYFISVGSGNMGIAALNIAMPVFTIFSSIGLMFGFGSATIMSIAEGRNNKEERNKAFTCGIFFMILMGFLIMVFTTCFPILFARLLGSNDVLLPYVCAYLKPICLSSIPFILMYALSILLRSDHNPKLAMYCMLAGNIFNIFMDYFFVAICHMGIVGAALATSLSPVVCLMVACIHFKRKDRVHFNKDFMDFSLIKRILNAGAGSGAMEISTGIIIFVFNIVILMIADELYLAAYGIVTNIMYVLKGVLNGFAQAAQPMISYYFGANETEKSKKSFYLSFMVSSIASILIYGLFVLFPSFVCIPFADGNNQLIEMASRGVILYFSALLFMSMNVMFMNYFQAIEKGKIAIFIAVCKGFIFVLLYLLLLVPMLKMDGVWLCSCFAEMSCLILSILFLKREKRFS